MFGECDHQIIDQGYKYILSVPHLWKKTSKLVSAIYGLFETKQTIILEKWHFPGLSVQTYELEGYMILISRIIYNQTITTKYSVAYKWPKFGISCSKGPEKCGIWVKNIVGPVSQKYTIEG